MSKHNMPEMTPEEFEAQLIDEFGSDFGLPRTRKDSRGRKQSFFKKLLGGRDPTNPENAELHAQYQVAQQVGINNDAALD